MTTKNLLITGANGCVGQYLVEWFLTNSDFYLYLMVRNPDKLPLSVRNNKKVKLLICDLRDCKRFDNQIDGIHYLIHTATAWGDPQRAYEVNIKAIEDLLGLLNKNNIKKIIYFSTASILDKNIKLMREAMTYGTEYIQTKYECYKRLQKNKFADITYAVFPTLVFGGTLETGSKFPKSYLTDGLMEANKWLWLARFFKLDSKFHFIHARDIAQVCGFLIKKSSLDKKKGLKKYVLGQEYISIDEALNILLKRNSVKRYFSIPLKSQIIKILLKILPIQTTNWDRFSIQKYDFYHKTITNPESFGLTSHAKTLEDILEHAKLPRCNIN